MTKTHSIRTADPLNQHQRDKLVEAPRPRRRVRLLPARRHLPLLPARTKDAAYRPIYAVWELTLRCDLACRHCGSRAGKARPDELTTSEALDTVRQLAELGVREVTLIGGEAYLHEGWVEVANAIAAAGMKATITTGGRGMTPERARQAFEAGVRAVSVSLDGLAPTHDRLRGVSGSHAAALDAMDNLRAAGLRVLCNSQINRLTMPELPALLELLATRRVRDWMLIVTVPMGRAADEPDVLLQPYDMLNLFPMLAELSQHAKALGVLVQPSNNLGYFGPYEHILRGHLGQGCSSSCGAGRTTIGLEANGDVKGCPSLPSSEWVGGNLRDAPLREVWERGQPLRYTRDRTVEDLWGYCRRCYYAEACLAGCTWSSHVLLGKPGNNPYCHHRALEMQRAGKRERLAWRAQAPGTPFDFGQFTLVEEDLQESASTAGNHAQGGNSR
ncbi:MAG: radical SAM protein [Myxococcales bacterium]|nr:radical SAM protein [Myxococcales bacterium]